MNKTVQAILPVLLTAVLIFGCGTQPQQSVGVGGNGAPPISDL